MNLRKKDNNKNVKDKKKSKQLWHHLPIQSLKIKKNKSDLKIKKCLDILRINLKKKNRTNKKRKTNNKIKKDK